MGLEELSPVSRPYAEKLLEFFIEEGLLKPQEDCHASQVLRPPGVAIAYITISEPERLAGVWQVSDAGCKKIRDTVN